MHHDLLDSNFFLVLFWYECVIVSNPHSVVLSVVAIPKDEVQTNRAGSCKVRS